MNNKIFHILAGKANPNTLNGVNKVVDAIATEQTKLGLEVTVVGLANNTEKRHNPIYNYQLFENKKKFSYTPSVLAYLLNNSDVSDIFHFHSVFIPWYLPLIRDLKRNGRNHIVLTPHGQYVDDAMNSSLKKRLFFRLVDKKILKEVECVHIIGCKTENNSYIRNNSCRQVSIPNGFGCQQAIISSVEPKPIIGYLGRLDCKQKGLDVLIKAFSAYRKQGGAMLLALAGSGPDEQKLRHLVNLEGLDSSVLFKGSVFNENKWAFICECAAMISPSRWEGVPTSCLEGAFAYRPQLVTENTNLGPYVKKYAAGFVIENSDPSLIVKQLLDFEEVYRIPERYVEMCNGARKMVDEELNWENITKRIVEELYVF